MKNLNPRDHISVIQLIALLSGTLTTTGFLDIQGIAKDISIDVWIPVLVVFLLREHTVFTILLMPVYFLMSNLPLSIADIFITREAARWVSIFVLFLPFLLLIMTKLKRKVYS